MGRASGYLGEDFQNLVDEKFPENTERRTRDEILEDVKYQDEDKLKCEEGDFYLSPTVYNYYPTYNLDVFKQSVDTFKNETGPRCVFALAYYDFYQMQLTDQQKMSFKRYGYKGDIKRIQKVSKNI